MTETEATRAADVLREAGLFDAADHLETAARVERESRYTQWWQARWEDDTWDLH
jgi:hypothetical protein